VVVWGHGLGLCVRHFSLCEGGSVGDGVRSWWGELRKGWSEDRPVDWEEGLESLVCLSFPRNDKKASSYDKQLPHMQLKRRFTFQKRLIHGGATNFGGRGLFAREAVASQPQRKFSNHA
jgi:hypothetical protein